MMKQLNVIPIEDCCGGLRAPLGQRDAERLASALDVMADPTRLRLVSLISQQAEVCACDLVKPLGLSQGTVSHHLKVLTEAGVLNREQRGKWAWFRVKSGPIKTLAATLSQDVTATAPKKRRTKP